jgi:hypothetical protein
VGVVFLAAAGLLTAFAVHLAIWRLRVPRRTTIVLAAIFAAGLVTELLVARLLVPGFGWSECLYSTALYGAIALTYLLLYTGIECDSPTLSLARYIALGGPNGRSRSDIDDFIRSHPFIQSRLKQLERGGFVIRRDQYLELAKASSALIELGESYRRLMGRTTRGG